MSTSANDIATLCDEAKALIEVLRESAELAGKGWFGVGDAARYASLSPKSIRRAISAGKLQASRPVSGKVLIERQALDRWLRSDAKQTTSPRGHALERGPR